MAKKIGIVAGAGPEAGIDLWQKILAANRKKLGGLYRGDLDAPDVTVMSVPGLGLAMDIRQNEEAVWNILEETLRSLDKGVDLICIACNALHHYQGRILALGLKAEFISIVDCSIGYIVRNRLERLALLSISGVMRLDHFSPYAPLTRYAEIETPGDPETIDRLVRTVKCEGAGNPALRTEFREILGRLRATTVLLACTELPLVSESIPGVHQVDVTQLLAEKLVEKVLQTKKTGTETCSITTA
jgi:aspartate racemase